MNLDDVEAGFTALRAAFAQVADIALHSAVVSCRGVSQPGATGSAVGPTGCQFFAPAFRFSSVSGPMPCMAVCEDALRPPWASWMPIAVSWRRMNSISGLKLSACASFQMPRSFSLISPTSSTAGRLDEDQPEPAERVAAEMHDVEGAAGVAGVAAVMDHRRYDEPVFHGEVSNCQGLEKPWPRRSAAIRSVHHCSASRDHCFAHQISFSCAPAIQA